MIRISKRCARLSKRSARRCLPTPNTADDFIQPVKSQGVYKVGNSVLTFRVKFTAKPGKQFVIKREAFRLALKMPHWKKKGIYFAHRKVIVEIPETHAAFRADDGKDQKAADA